MQYKVLLKPEAYYDIDEIIAWYEEKKKGLGIDFSQRIVTVYAVLHTSRDPDLILKRIK